MFKEFKEFTVRGNVIDMAVGLTVGAAFGAIAKSLVTDIIMPPVGLLFGGMNFSDFFILLKQGDPAGPYQSLAEASEAGATVMSYGMFINTIITFIVVALVMFLVIRQVNHLHRQEEEAPPEPTTKECPFCLSEIPIKATRCAHCTSQLSEPAPDQA